MFANGLDPAGGPGLIFVTMSAAFGQMPGGAVVGTVFFFLVFVAALTSAISMLEVATSRAEETKGLSRKRMAPVVGLVAFLLGLIRVFSFSAWENVHPLDWLPGFQGKAPFPAIDHLVTNIMLPLGGMLYALFAGWVLSRDTTVGELGMGDGNVYEIWRFLVRVVAPLAVFLVFLANLV